MNFTSTFLQNETRPVSIDLVIPLIKFFVGLITVILYAVILLCLTSCTSIGYSSRMFLLMIFSYNLVYYFVLTFYSPFVGAGFIQVHNVTIKKIISTIILTPIYALHLGQMIIAVERLVIFEYSSKHARLFSPYVTKLYLLIIFLYGFGFGLMSWADCCYFVYNPINQVWSYPNDVQTNYRLKVGLFSNYINAIITLAMYTSILLYVHKIK